MLVEGVLRFGRGIAFAAATAYAVAAEARGTWDARLEALVVDAVVRGPLPDDVGRAGDDDALVSRAAALGWDPALPARVVVGAAPDPASAAERLAELRRHGVRTRSPVLARCRAPAGRRPGRGRKRPTRPTTRDRASVRPVVVGPGPPT